MLGPGLQMHARVLGQKSERGAGPRAWSPKMALSQRRSFRSERLRDLRQRSRRADDHPRGCAGCYILAASAKHLEGSKARGDELLPCVVGELHQMNSTRAGGCDYGLKALLRFHPARPALAHRGFPATMDSSQPWRSLGMVNPFHRCVPPCREACRSSRYQNVVVEWKSALWFQPAQPQFPVREVAGTPRTIGQSSRAKAE